MLELKVCIYRNDQGNLESWLDLDGIYASCEEFEKNVCDEMDVKTTYTFSIRPQDLTPELQPLFFALATTQKAMAESKTPLADHLPTHLLEKVIDIIIQRLQPARWH